MRVFIAVLFLFVPMWARGATCTAGQYLENNVCTDCNANGNGYYCPGDDMRHDCPSADSTNFQQLLTECGLHDVPEIQITVTSWGRSGSGSASLYDCVAAKSSIVSREGWFIVESHYNTGHGNYWNGCQGNGIWFYAANAGYYLSGYKNSTSRDWYTFIKPCTNEHPTHSHYSGPGTPDEPVKTGGRTDYNDCPWECDDGYGRHNNECLPLCTAGATKFHVGNYVFNIYKDKLTTPAINIAFSDGTVCYVSLVSGVGKGALNVDYHGVIYHTSD